MNILSRLDVYFWIYVAFLFMGVAGIYITYNYLPDNREFISISSALIGASFGGLLTRLSNKASHVKHEQRVLSYLDAMKDLVSPGLTSEPDFINSFRKKYYLYHVTRKRKKFVWVCSNLDFSKKITPNKLQCKIKIQRDEDSPLEYSCEGFIRNSRLVIVRSAVQSSEPPGIYIFPMFSDEYRESKTGFLVHVTYDSEHSLSATLISAKKLHNSESNFNVPESDFEILNNIWKENKELIKYILSMPKKSEDEEVLEV